MENFERSERDKQIDLALTLINFIDFRNDDLFLDGYNNIFGIEYSKNDLENKKKDLRIRVLNFLYSGEWDLKTQSLGKSLNPLAEAALGLAVIKEKATDLVEPKTNFVKEKDLALDNLMEKLSLNWINIYKSHEEYIDTLKPNTADKIIVYEAPPFPKESTSNYLLFNEAKGPYAKAIKEIDTSKDSVKDKLVNNNVLFFDLILLPIPLSSSIRRKWFEFDDFYIYNEPLPVFLLKMNLNYYNDYINSESPSKFAIGTPHLTALPIFNYFSENNNPVYESLRVTNDIHTRQNKSLKDLVIPLFKSCFVNASNNPDGTLLKLAFGEI